MKNLFSSLKTHLLGEEKRFFNLENKLYKEEELLNNYNFDSFNKNDLQGSDLYLNTVTSAENHIGGGKLRFVRRSCVTLCSNEGDGRITCYLYSLIFKPSIIGGVF